MKIVLDARGIRSGMTGVGHYTRYLVEALPRIAPDDTFVFLALRGADPSLRPSLGEWGNAEWLEVDADPESHPGGDWWEWRSLPRLLDKLDADVFHGPAYRIPFGRRPCRAARVVSIHDLSVWTYPKAYSLGFRMYLRRCIVRSLRSADRALFLSDFVRGKALSLVRGLNPEVCHTVAPAPAGPYSPMPHEGIETWRERLGLPAEFLLCVGTLETRKNPRFLIRLHRELARRRTQKRTPLIVWLGMRGHSARKFLRRFARLRRAGAFRYRETFSPEILKAHYNCATALVYPSFDEGFGLPIAEAMACGLPVIASDRTSLPEVVADGGRCLSLDNVAEWADAVEKILDDGGERDQARRRALERSRAFSWERTATETLRVYRAAAAGAS
ncbi:glycosyltransferase family 4 protein [Candidatus Sumerlaeota bacterium]|nr:glycosyltransferase family 4 protein [Candidatus Sumerlaeota bacterium]